MIEVFDDIWELAKTNKVGAIVITTNGFIKKNGEAVMGRGIAREAAIRYPELPKLLGHQIKYGGNRVWWLMYDITNKYDLVSMPVKHNWWEKADIDLILKSTKQLVEYFDALFDPADPLTTILMPRPGCGNGGLKWEDVKPVIEPYLDDRFLVAHK